MPKRVFAVTEGLNGPWLELHEPVEGYTFEGSDEESGHKSVISGNVPNLRLELINMLTRRTLATKVVQHWWHKFSRVVDRIPLHRTGTSTTCFL